MGIFGFKKTKNNTEEGKNGKILCKSGRVKPLGYGIEKIEENATESSYYLGSNFYFSDIDEVIHYVCHIEEKTTEEKGWDKTTVRKE